jgi:hypothetical protein
MVIMAAGAAVGALCIAILIVILVMHRHRTKSARSVIKSLNSATYADENELEMQRFSGLHRNSNIGHTMFKPESKRGMSTPQFTYDDSEDLSPRTHSFEIMDRAEAEAVPSNHAPGSFLLRQATGYSES